MSSDRCKINTSLFSTIIVLAAASLANAETVYLSVVNNLNNGLGGLVFRDGDIVAYDPGTDTSTLFFNEDAFGGLSVDLTAFHLFPDGSFLLSVLFNNRTLGGLTFDDGDLVRYDPATDTASFYFLTESSFTDPNGNPDISGVSVRANGNILLSLNADNVLAGLAFTQGDVVEYDPIAQTATIFLSEATLCDDGDCDVDALHERTNGHLILSFASDEVISGVPFLDGDLVDYDAVTDSATLFLSEGLFDLGIPPNSDITDINAVFVQEDSTLLLGDVNCDGVVNVGDIPAFALALVDPAEYANQFPACGTDRADTNSDTLADGADVQSFIVCVINSGCP